MVKLKKREMNSSSNAETSSKGSRSRAPFTQFSRWSAALSNLNKGFLRLGKWDMMLSRTAVGIGFFSLTASGDGGLIDWSWGGQLFLKETSYLLNRDLNQESSSGDIFIVHRANA